jgi:hypothetical protein
MSLTYYDLGDNETDFSKLFNGTRFDVIVIPYEILKYMDKNHLGDRMLISIKNGRPKHMNEQMYQTNISDLILELKYILKEKLHILLFDYRQKYRTIFMPRADFIWTDLQLNSKQYQLVHNIEFRGKYKFYRYRPNISKIFFRPPI